MKDKLSEHNILSNIETPDDLKRVPLEQLPQVCAELRKYIIDVLSQNPGHLASNLGSIELTVALHYVFNTPDDRIVWDVGHQTYAHKILTGRKKKFPTNRKWGGLCPFPSPLESIYDTATCGHASNSISLALGMCVAAEKECNDRKVVCVIGDGAMSGGLAFEGINNVSVAGGNILIVLNDNDMSIDHSVGGMKQCLMRLHTSPIYNGLRFKLARKFMEWGWMNEQRRKSIIRFNNAIKSLIFNRNGQNFFEGFNIRYFGPADGHDVIGLVHILRDIKEMKGPKILHLKTQKGKGYGPAEKDADIWHAPGKFNPETGERQIDSNENKPLRFQEIFGETLLELAKQNEKIVGVTPAMLSGCSMDILKKEMPNRTFDVGIAEGHAVTFSAGMAKDGLLPFCNIYSSFSQRAYDNIIHDTAILNLPIVICLDRAGLVGEDGPTHHGAFDLAALRIIPNLTIASPMDERELRHLMYTAQLPEKGTFVIRYPRGRGVLTDWKCTMHEITVGTGRKLKDGNDMAVLSIGPIGNAASQAIQRIEHETGCNIAHYDMRFLKPLDENILETVGKRFSKVVTIEDGVRDGGLGSAVLEWFSDHDMMVQVTRIGLPDKFIEHGAVKKLHEVYHLDTEGIANTIRSLVSPS